MARASNDSGLNDLRESIYTSWYKGSVALLFSQELLGQLFYQGDVLHFLEEGVTEKLLHNLLNAVSFGAGLTMLQTSFISFLHSRHGLWADAGALAACYPAVQQVLFERLFIIGRLVRCLKWISPHRLSSKLFFRAGGQDGEEAGLRFFNSIFQRHGAFYGVLALATVGNGANVLAYASLAAPRAVRAWWHRGRRLPAHKWKQLAVDGSIRVTQTVLGYGARVAGAKIGLWCSRGNKNSKMVFTSMHSFFLLSTFLIFQWSTKVGEGVKHKLDARFPVTEEEKEEEEQKKSFQDDDMRAFVEIEALSGGESLYSILGVERSADSAAIRRAYRTQSLKYHPDRVPRNNPQAISEAETKMRQINQAYEILQHSEKRAVYDTKLRDKETSIFGTPMDDVESYLKRMSPWFSVPASIFGIASVVYTAGITLHQFSFSLFRQATSPGIF